MKDETTCGIVIYDRRRKVIRTCGQRSVFSLTMYGDQLFSFCSRHQRRISRVADLMNRV